MSGKFCSVFDEKMIANWMIFHFVNFLDDKTMRKLKLKILIISYLFRSEDFITLFSNKVINLLETNPF